jgi:hypothetical protein
MPVPIPDWDSNSVDSVDWLLLIPQSWLYNLGSDHIEKAALTLLSGLAVTK